MTDSQPELLPASPAADSRPPEDQAQREQYRQRLREALRDPQFRQIPGFPRGEDEAILALSDPPHYTACPNPFLEEMVTGWQAEREQIRQQLGLPDDRQQNGYHREPFAADVSEGKNDPIYNAHSYHTKVPHKAIMRYILHYTDPGDIVLDGFCGTGMTGVAAQLCGDKKAVQSLGYRVDEQGNIFSPSPSGRGERGEGPISRLGARKAVLVDLSPAAAFIAYNYNTPVDARAFEREARRLLAEVEKECGWMYLTSHPPSPSPLSSQERGEGAQGERGEVKGKINYTVWSDVFRCPACGAEMTFWDVAVDHAGGRVRDEWPCPQCAARLSKSPKQGSGALRLERAFETRFDRALGQSVRQAKQAPVLINYSMGKKRYEKRPDEADLALLEKIEASEIPYPFPTQPLPKGDKTRDPFNVGLTHVHHFHTRRNLWALAAIVQKSWKSANFLPLLFMITSFSVKTGSRLHNIGLKNGRINLAGAVPNALYIPSSIAERNILLLAAEKLNYLVQAFSSIHILQGKVAIHTGSSHRLSVKADSIDYIFIDPPFGANLMYSELNFLWEAWLGVFTDNAPEAVVNKTQRKGLPEYQALMEACFREFYRLLKPGRWMTVEFHNSQNAVWNSIQEAILRAGFVVADVHSIDKQQGTFNQMTSTAAVKQDLVISAYKPSAAFEREFQLRAGAVEGVWAFVRQHLAQLPVVVRRENLLEPVAERMPYLLFDRMVAFHIQRGLTVPLSAAEFYAGLEERFVLRDGMVFLPEQTPEYDRARLEAEGLGQLALFVSDEKSALQWLRRALDPAQGGAPQTYAELQPAFLKQLHQARHEALPELGQLLEENFLQEADGRWRLPDPRRAGDLEALRRKALLREFKTYLEATGRLRQFRSEAVRAGFAEAYRQQDWQTILKVAARLAETALQEDPELLMYYDAASLRDRTKSG